MPEKKDFPPRPKGARVRYPWADWADGEPREFVRGKDFYVDPHQFVVAAKRLCKRYGWALDAVVDGEKVFLKITPPDLVKPKKLIVRKVTKK